MKKIGISLDALEPVFEKIGKLSQVIRIVIAVGVFVALIGGVVYLAYIPKFQRISELKQELDQAQQQLAIMQQQAAKLEEYQEKLAKAEKQFEIIKKRLPEEKDIPSLLEDISLFGHEAGLEFVLFEPKGVQKKEFYARVPVKIIVRGGYEELETFFDKISKMSRIVNIKNVAIKPGKEGEKLTTTCRADTYMFIEPAGQQAEKK
ncbi:type 4a pilus biogenesis protein PilO [Thermodesulfobacteriota bacterium]